MTDHCSARVNDPDSRSVRRCSRRGSVHENGSWWCKQHYPSRAKNRQEVEFSELRRAAKHRDLQRAIVAARDQIAETAIACADQWYNDSSRDDLDDAVHLWREAVSDLEELE